MATENEKPKQATEGIYLRLGTGLRTRLNDYARAKELSFRAAVVTLLDRALKREGF